jgi:hypothetical protein
VDAVLLRLGAINSLDSVTAVNLYKLLMELPSRDPEGNNAPSIYRTLLETGGIETDSARREDFIQHGKMWGRQGEKVGYFDVKQLRYWPRGVMPRPLRQIIPLVMIDPRKNSKEVQRIFGVDTLRAEEFSIEVSTEHTDFRDWSVLANAHFVAARPYLYALRLSQRADEDGRQRRLLLKAQLFVCRKISAKVRYAVKQNIPIVADSDLEGMVVGHQLYLVSHEDEFPASDSLFWRAVADLLADLLEVSVAAEFSALLMCDPGYSITLQGVKERCYLNMPMMR